MIIAYRLAFCLHYMLLQWFRNHAEWERNPFPRINICDCIICQHLQELAGAGTAAESGIRQQCEVVALQRETEVNHLQF